jgi:4-diphosphocytidyl-2-C-methyl-D-erythritol kinase
VGAAQARIEGLTVGHFALLKRLPVAAGIGGGSSDAAAALRLLARANGLAGDDPRLLEAARATGADVAVCLDPRPKVMRGVGDVLSAPLALPQLGCVLVNPGVPVATPPVFRALGLQPGTLTGLPPAPDFTQTTTPADLLTQLAAARNDLTAPALQVAPVIATVLERLAATPRARLVRMSGSGATCFALYDSCRAAALAAKLIRRHAPDWWLRSTVVGGIEA